METDQRQVSVVAADVLEDLGVNIYIEPEKSLEILKRGLIYASYLLKIII